MTAATTPSPDDLAYKIAGAPAITGPRTFFLEVPANESEAVATAVAQQVSLKEQLFLSVDCSRAFPISLQPIRELLAYLIPVMQADAPDLLQRYGPEAAYLLPNLRSDNPALADVPKLTEIALGPSERRLHKESEIVFRSIHAATSLILGATERASAVQNGLVLFFHHLDQADRNTVKAVYRLARRIHGSPVTVVATLSPAGGSVPETVTLLDESGGAQRLLASVIRRTAHIAKTLTARGSLAAEAIPFPPLVRALLPEVQGLLRGMAATVMPSGAGFPMAGPAGVVAPGDPMEDREPALVAETLRRLEQGDRSGALEFGLRALEAMFESLNHEGTFRLIKLLFPLTEGENDLRIRLWKFAGPAHAFMLEFREAVRCYEEALKLATTPVQRAQLKLFIGLLWGKRLHDIPTARQYLQSGLEDVDGREDGDALVEKAWLSNVSALCCFSEREYQEAINVCQPALKFISPLRDSEAVHIKVNLISNITVVLETVGHHQKAVDMWQYFRSFLGHGSDILAKHYWYREGGLHLRNGSPVEALTCFEQCFSFADRIHDDFHREIAARAVGYLHWSEGRYAEALTWYERGLESRRRLADDAAIASSYLQIAVVQRYLGNGSSADEAGSQALWHSDRAAQEDPVYNPRDTVKNARQLQEASDPEALARAAEAVLERPTTKLNRAFFAIIP